MKHRKQFAIIKKRSSPPCYQRSPLTRALKYGQLILLMIPILFFTACGGSSGALWGPGGYQGNTSTNYIVNQGGLIILAAPTLQNVLPGLVNAFLQARHLNIPYVFDFSSSKAVSNTANTATDSDLLITDDRAAMINARYFGFTTSDGTLIATDVLSLILPASNPGHITSLQDLTTSGLSYLGISNYDGLSVHIQDTLESMSADPTFGTHYATRVYGNLTSDYTDGLTAARSLTTNPPAGDFSIVYHTNYLAVQKGSNALTELPIPGQFNPPDEIIAAVTGQSHNSSLAQQLIDFLRSPSASSLWTSFGFTPTV